MALRFSSGLLTGLQQYGQGGGAIPADPRQRDAMQAAGVTNPLLQQFGRGLGGMLGTDMRSADEIEKEKQAQAMDAAFKASTQGTAAAQQGNVAAVTSQINALQQAMAATTDLSAKRMYGQQIQQLTSMIPDAQKTEVSNNAKAILRAEQAIAGGEIENEQARRAMEARVEELKKDPEAMREYNNFKMQEWQTQRAQQDMKADAWIKANGSAITQALKDDDFDEVTKLVTGAGEYTEAAQAYVNRAQQNIKAMRELEENSIERKTAPSVEMWEEQINSLPEEVRAVLEPSLKAYKNAAKGWNENTQTWNTGARIAANRIEKQMTGLFNNMMNQLAVSDFSMSRREEAKKAEQIKDLELKLNTKMSTKYINDARIYANSIIKNPDDNDIQRIAESFYARDQEVYRSQLEYLQQDSEAIEEGDAPADDGGFSVKVNGNVTTRAMVQEAIATVGEAETRRKLKNAGLSDGQIQALIGGDFGVGSEEMRAKTNEELIMEGGGINPYRMQRNLSQSPLAP
jgi:hypothetical protein